MILVLSFVSLSVGGKDPLTQAQTRLEARCGHGVRVDLRAEPFKKHGFPKTFTRADMVAWCVDGIKALTTVCDAGGSAWVQDSVDEIVCEPDLRIERIERYVQANRSSLPEDLRYGFDFPDDVRHRYFVSTCASGYAGTDCEYDVEARRVRFRYHKYSHGGYGDFSAYLKLIRRRR